MRYFKPFLMENWLRAKRYNPKPILRGALNYMRNPLPLFDILTMLFF